MIGKNETMFKFVLCFEKEVFDTFAEPGYKKIVFMTIDDG